VGGGLSLVFSGDRGRVRAGGLGSHLGEESVVQKPCFTRIEQAPGHGKTGKKML
jgi:hypothetical protein